MVRLRDRRIFDFPLLDFATAEQKVFGFEHEVGKRLALTNLNQAL